MPPPPMKFCPQCKNMLLPKEDKERRILINSCRICDYREPADNNRVYANEVQGEYVEVIYPELVEDPTLPRDKAIPCPQCNSHGVVYFLSKPKNEERMTLNYICCNLDCRHRWSDA